ncbi:MAG: hypothetical protein ABI442_16650 [Gemmatimonadaceae bacterium]
MSASCAGRAHAAASDLPHIDAVRPDTVVARFGAVVEVVIGGRGFAPGSPGMNALEFAGSRINAVPSNATGTEIRFVIPETIPSTSEAPPRPLMGGTYIVRIVTGAGTSNGMPVTVVR